MDRNTLALVSALLSTLVHRRGPTPRSIVMLGLGIDYREYQAIEAGIVGAGWATTTSETITLTKSGREKGKNVNAILEGET